MGCGSTDPTSCENGNGGQQPVDNPPVCTSVTPIGKMGCSNFPNGVDLGNPTVTWQNHPQCGTKDEGGSLNSCPAEGCRVGCYLGGNQGNDPWVGGNEAFNVSYPSSSSVRLTVAPNGGSHNSEMMGCGGGSCSGPINCTSLYDSILPGPWGCDDPPPLGYGCRHCNPDVGNVIVNACISGSCSLPDGQSEGNYTPPTKTLTYNIPTYTGSSTKPAYLIFDVVNNNLGSTARGFVCTIAGCRVIKHGENLNNAYLPLVSSNTTFRISIQYTNTPPSGSGFTVTNVRPAWTPDSTISCPLSTSSLPVVVNATDDKGWSTSTDPRYAPVSFSYGALGVQPAKDALGSWAPGNPAAVNTLTYAPPPNSNTNLYAQVSDNSGQYPGHTTSCPATTIACTQTPYKSCSVTVTNGSALTNPAQPITITVSGSSQNTDTVRLWLEKKDGTIQTAPVTGTLGAPGTTTNKYYLLASCPASAGGAPCTKNVIINTPTTPLPIGDYYVHCDVPTDNAPNPPYEKCAGDPFCSYKNIATGVPPQACIGWQFCSTLDNLPINIALPTPITLTGTVFNDTNSNGCWDTGEPAIDPALLTGKTLTINDGYSPAPQNISLTGTNTFTATIYSGYNTAIDGTNAAPTGLPQLTGYPNFNEGDCSRISNIPPIPAGFENSAIFSTSQPNYIKNIGFSRNIGWLNVFDGDVYGNTGYTIRIPTPNFLINGVAGGVGISSGGIITYLDPPTNQTSIKGTVTPPGWEITDYLPSIKYLSDGSINFTAPLTSLPLSDWATPPLTVGSIFTSDTTLGATNYALSGDGVVTVFINGSLNINGDIVSNSVDRQGIVLVVNGDVTISNTVTNIDAMIVASGKISTENIPSSVKLTINGALMAKGDIDLKSRSIPPENSTPAVTVNFKPLYLDTRNNVLTKTSTTSWREITPTN